MSLLLIFIPLAIIYFALLTYLFKRFHLGRIQIDEEQDPQPVSQLPQIVKKILTIFYCITLAGVCFWPVFMFVMGISQANQANWGIDISIFGKMYVDIKLLSDVAVNGLRDPVLHGITDIHFDTSNRTVWWLFACVQEISLIAVLYGVRQFQTIFACVAAGYNFSNRNIQSIKNLAKVVIIWNCLMPILQWVMGNIAFGAIDFSTKAISLTPAFSIDILPLFIGLVLFVLAEVMQQGAQIEKEQSLTI